MIKQYCRLALFVFWAAIAQAYDIRVLNHVPPVAVNASTPLELTIPAEGLKEARVLVGTSEGYRILPMIRTADHFRAEVGFNGLAELAYEFQVRAADGATYESNPYSVHLPANPKIELSLAALTMEKEVLRARSLQLANALYSLRQEYSLKPELDKKALAKVEAGQVLLALGRQERKAETLRADLSAKLAGLEERLNASDRGKLVSAGRSALAEDGEL